MPDRRNVSEVAKRSRSKLSHVEAKNKSSGKKKDAMQAKRGSGKKSQPGRARTAKRTATAVEIRPGSTLKAKKPAAAKVAHSLNSTAVRPIITQGRKKKLSQPNGGTRLSYSQPETNKMNGRSTKPPQGMSRQRTERLLELARNHARKCPSFAAELEREGF